LIAVQAEQRLCSKARTTDKKKMRVVVGARLETEKLVAEMPETGLCSGYCEANV
jgi:hypothetical protein